METRGRGREARASTDENQPSTTRATDRQDESAPSQQQIPSTRSRTRLRTVSLQRSQSTRATRASAANPAVRFVSSAPQGSQHTQPLLTVNSRSRRAPSSKRNSPTSATGSTTRAASSQRQTSSAAAGAQTSVTRQPPQTRKRTRSSSRRHSSQVTSSAQPSSSAANQHGTRSASVPASAAAASAAVAAALSARPLKRARRASHGGRHSRSTANLTSTGRGSGAGSSLRRLNREMDLSNSQGGGNDRHTDQDAQRRDEDGPSSLGSDRAGSHTLQGLLRRLGADLSDIFPGNGGTSHTRMQQLRSAISSPESDEQQINALSELCEFLSVGTEESLVSFSVNLFVAPLVNLLRSGNNIEIKILAARALTHMMEALPSSSSSIANHGAAGPLCQNLLSIEYIDLAEQSLSALQKLSMDYPQQIVSANGFQAVLSFIDFFSIGMQRVAAATACNLCRHPRADAMEMISGVLPTMMRLLDSDDQRIRESAVLGFTRLAESFRNTSSKLEALCGEKAALIEKVLGLIVPSSPPALAPQSYSSALRLLAILARGSSNLGMQILSTKSLILRLNSRLGSGTALHSFDCLVLADSLLPDFPDLEGTHSSAVRSRRRRNVGSAAAHAAVDVKRREELEKNAAPLQFFGQTLFATLMKFYVSSADSNARRLALSIMSKFIAISSEGVLREVIPEREDGGNASSEKSNVTRFCPFVAALLSENSSREMLVGLAMADAAVQKLPSLRDSFIREGVVHEIARLAALDEGDGGDGDEDAGQSPSNEASGAGAGSGDGPTEQSTRALADQPVGSGAMRNMDSIWSAVAAIQRGSLQRGSRGDLVIGSQRFPSRTLADVRFPNMQSLSSMVPKTARKILKTHLGANPDGTMEESILKNTILGSLTEVCSLLKSASSPRHEAKGVEGLTKFIRLLTSSERLTVFEISRSGLMEALAAYLNPVDPKVKSSRMVTFVRCLNEDQGRGAFSSLVTLTLGVLSAEEKLSVQATDSAGGTGTASVSSGLRQLAQPFKLRLRRASAGDGGASLRDYSHHVVLIEPLATMASVQEFLWPKVRESDRSGGPGSSSGPASTRRRGSHNRSRSGRSSGTGEQEEEAGTTASGEGNDEQQGDEMDDGQYPEEAMFDMEEDNNEEDEMVDDEDDDDQNSDASDDDVSSREEDVIEHDAGDSDEQEQEGADAFDMDQLGTSLPPFELHHDTLGQAPSRSRRGSGSPPDAPTRGGSASRSPNDQANTFRSYAAALAANMPRASGSDGLQNGNSHRHATAEPSRETSAKPPAPPKLTFLLNGKKVPHDCSILSAVIQSTAEERGIGPRLWSDIHTLVYSKADGQAEDDGSGPQNARKAQSSGEKSSARTSPESAGPVRRSQRLLENREKSQQNVANTKVEHESEASSRLLSKVVISNGVIPILRKSPASDLPAPIAPVIEVLKQLHWICNKMNDRSLRKEGVPSIIQGLREDADVRFHSDKLSAKLIRQLSDPLALCGGVVPTWCFSLSRDASFLIPFETRKILFQSTSLGVARALHLLQTRVDASGLATPSHRGSRGHRDADARIGRIQRQKVRLHRNRILESAIKVMNLYGAHSTVLEVEYFNEVGTGLGPTLEFYTLASREIQRVDLGLWRGHAPKVAKQKNQTTDRTQGDVGKTSKADGNSRTTTVKRRSRRHTQEASVARTSEGVFEDEESPAYVIPTGSGLYPSCLPVVVSESQKEASSKSTALFGFVGRLLGKAMIDGRLLDLRFSKTFSRLLLSYCRVIFEKWKHSEVPNDNICNNRNRDSVGRGKPFVEELDAASREQVWDIFTAGNSAMKLLEDVDPQLATSLKAIISMVHGGQSDSISSLCLTFVLPGDDDVELVKGGTDVEVTGANALEFVRRVVYHVLFGGVQKQTEALLQGLSEVLDITSLLAFESNELELLICGPCFEEWSVEFLVQATRCDHGYSHESPAVLHFLRILSEMDQADQQRFVMFSTGSPALPLGGLRNLHPKLTIVRRTPEAGRSPDECLPTVMTCTNYFKLPDYSSFEIARKQVLYAVREGQGSFHLS